MHVTSTIPTTPTMELPGHRPPSTSSVQPPSVLQLGSSPPQSWLHSPPTQMPWGTSQPRLVRFRAGVNGLSGGGTRYMMTTVPATQVSAQPSVSLPPTFTASAQATSPPSVGLKRKFSMADDTEMICAVSKLHISEDKLAKHQRGVHALSQLAKAQLELATPEPSTSETPTVRTVEEIAEGQCIVLSEEVQNFNNSHSSILPETLLNKMKRPSMALVLWQPPARPLPAAQWQSNSDDEDDLPPAPSVAEVAIDQDNNNSSTIDLNNMPSFNDNVAVAQPVAAPPPAMGMMDLDDVEMEDF